MKKWVLLFSLFGWFLFQAGASAEISSKTSDSRELQLQDMLMLFLGDYIEKAVEGYYSKYLKESPLVYPYQADVVGIERVGGFRTFHFRLTLEMTPVVGPHISVGRDRAVFEIDPTLPGQVKLIDYKHLETHDLPPQWQHIKK